MDTLVSGYCKASSRKGLMEPLARPRAPRSKFHLEPCPMSVSPNPFGLDFGTLDFGTLDLGFPIKQCLFPCSQKQAKWIVLYFSRPGIGYA